MSYKFQMIFLIAMILLLSACSSKYEPLAKCLTDKGVKMYGAFWCPHCANEKNKFEGAFKYVTYVECSLPDRSGQTQICKDMNVSSYPTWIFQDGTRLSGETSPELLAQRSGCAIG